MPPARRRTAFNADRLLNRLWDYPRLLRRQRDRFDLHHVCDHAYANVVHMLPRGRTGVFCHDLDTFRSILDPAIEPRPRWFRAMARQILKGLQKADVVFHTTAAVRAQIVRHGLVDERRLVQAPYGISTEFTAEPIDEASLRSVLPTSFHEGPYLLACWKLHPAQANRRRTRQSSRPLVRVAPPCVSCKWAASGPPTRTRSFHGWECVTAWSSSPASIDKALRASTGTPP